MRVVGLRQVATIIVGVHEFGLNLLDLGLDVPHHRLKALQFGVDVVRSLLQLEKKLLLGTDRFVARSSVCHVFRSDLDQDAGGDWRYM